MLIPGAAEHLYSEADRAGIIAASTDPVALDAWPPGRSSCLPLGRRDTVILGLWTRIMPHLDPSANGLGSLQREILNAGHPAAIDEKSMNVYLG